MRLRSFISRIKDSVATSIGSGPRGSEWWWKRSLSLPDPRKDSSPCLPPMATWEALREATGLSQSNLIRQWNNRQPRIPRETILMKACFLTSILMIILVIRKLTLQLLWCPLPQTSIISKQFHLETFHQLDYLNQSRGRLLLLHGLKIRWTLSLTRFNQGLERHLTVNI